MKAKLLAGMLLLPVMALAQDAASVLANSSKAMGAEQLQTLQYSGSGFDFVFGQAYSADDAWPKFNVTSYTRSLDFTTSGSRDERVRTQFENPPRGGGLQPIIGERRADTNFTVTASTPWATQLELWITPHGFLKAAATRKATLGTRTVGGKRYSVLSFPGDNGAAVEGFIGADGLVARVETRIATPVLGDTPLVAEYSDYKAQGAVQFPSHIVVRQGDYPTLDVTIDKVQPNVPVTITPAPPAAPAAAPVAAAAPAPAPGRLPVEKLDDGVFMILGAGAVSIAVDLGDRIAVLEAPADEARSAAVINEIKQLIPGKPIRHVVNTHHHFDHAGGLRSYLAEGATIVTDQSNEAYFKRIFASARTLNPALDAREKGRLQVKVDAVKDHKTLSGGGQSIELYHLRGNRHNAGLLMAYLPKQKILVEADVWGPPPAGATPPPVGLYTQNFLENLDRLKLDVTRVVPIHYPADRRPSSWQDMMRAVGRTP